MTNSPDSPDSPDKTSCAVFIATSLDGFIAREDGGIDWLSGPPGAEPADPAEDFGFHEFFSGIDALVMGRNTFDLLTTFPEWPYGEKPVIVLTSRALEIPERHAGKVEILSGTPEEVVLALAARGYRNLYIDGGITVQRFLRAGLVERLTIARLPVILGSGIPLFGATNGDIWLRHTVTKSYAQGLVQSTYEVLKL